MKKSVKRNGIVVEIAIVRRVVFSSSTPLMVIDEQWKEGMGMKEGVMGVREYLSRVLLGDRDWINWQKITWNWLKGDLQYWSRFVFSCVVWATCSTFLWTVLLVKRV